MTVSFNTGTQAPPILPMNTPLAEPGRINLDGADGQTPSLRVPTPVSSRLKGGIQVFQNQVAPAPAPMFATAPAPAEAGAAPSEEAKDTTIQDARREAIQSQLDNINRQIAVLEERKKQAQTAHEFKIAHIQSTQGEAGQVLIDQLNTHFETSLGRFDARMSRLQQQKQSLEGQLESVSNEPFPVQDEQPEIKRPAKQLPFRYFG